MKVDTGDLDQTPTPLTPSGDTRVTPDTLHKWQVAGLIATLVIVLLVPVYLVKEVLRWSGRGPRAGNRSEVRRQRKMRQDATGRRTKPGGAPTTITRWRWPPTVRFAAISTIAVFEYGTLRLVFSRKTGSFLSTRRARAASWAISKSLTPSGGKPLQQYLFRFPGGRLSAYYRLGHRASRWFYLYPDWNPPGDWLHWTRGGQNWNGMCAECHSTNLMKNYDPATKTFATTWSEIDVSCEACHGPGSHHVDWAEIPPMARPETENYDLVIPTSGISSRQQVELCAPCHSRRTELGDYDHTRPELLDNIVPSVLEEAVLPRGRADPR